MAITNSDGSIILSTKVDTTGIRSGMSKIKSDAGGLTKAFGKLASAIGVAFSVATIVQFSRESAKFATQTEASVQRLIDIYGQASDAVGDFIDANARALGMSKAAAASYASIYGNLFSVWADQKTNAQLTNHYLNMTAVVASKTGRTVADVQERIRSGLLGNTEAIEDLGIFVNVKTIEITEAFQRIANGRSWEQLTAYEQSQVRTLAILEQSTKKYGTEVANTTQSVRLRFQAAYEDFKNTWGQLVNTILIPVLSTLTKIFSVATAVINTLTGNTGGILGDSSQADTTGQIRDNIAESTENQKEFTDEIEETNKELKKTLAGFDDLQILSSNATEKEKVEISAPGTSDGANGLGLPNLPQVGGQDNFNPMAVVEKIKEALDFILPVISISLVVVGLILLSAGQIGWGLGFIIGGAYLYSVTERSGDKGFDFSVIKSDLDAILPYIDEALVAIGILLMFLGQIPIGIGFIIVGAIIYGAQEVSTSDYTGEDVITKLAAITEAVSLALVTIGIILIFFGNFPLGLGFIVAGKKLLDVAEQELNEGEVTTKIQKFFEDNKAIFVGVSAALVVLGICLLFVPSALPIALGLIFAGAGILATEASISMEEIPNMISEFISKNLALIEGISTALVVLGIILLFTGAGAPLGIGMIIAGGVGLLADEVFFNWDFIVEKIKTTWEKLKAFWRGDIAPVFSEQWWNILAITCINGLIAGFEGGINLIIILFENMINVIILGLNKISFDIPDWLGGGHFSLNLSPVSLGRVYLGRVPLPGAATGSLVPNSSITQRPFKNLYTDQTMAITMDGDYSAPRNLKTEVVLEVDGREFGRAVVEQGNMENRRIGTRMVVV